MSSKSLVSVILAGVVILIASKSVYIVKETERAVKLQFGEIVEPDIKPGLSFKIPFVNTIRKFDGRVLTLDSRPQAFLTIEKKRLIVDAFLKWKINSVETYYTATSGDEFRAADLLSARVENELRNQFGARTLNEVVSGERDDVMTEVIRRLNEVASKELGISIIDVRVKRVELPPEVSNSVYERMRTEREREARELRSRGFELAEGIRADADRQKTVLVAEAYRESEGLRGEGDAKAASIYADAYTKDSEFYSFTRSLKAYDEAFSGNGDIMMLKPDSEFFKYLRSSVGTKQ
ncbi:protease modulator HflC [Neptunomonas qingdaonensis]|uniref:Protein HflC n=1 Tax=Neptunomonas qingdaonensis TaxID=1045558 RepID=A0A1I2UHR3_9GAMM|nr:protease modulator HflC [Neptunomonas qingdaonensis]SFG74366.1 membrane protease subunit HflC [Neptunomonas qingdaonensis]